jgi:hypothetical protein
MDLAFSNILKGVGTFPFLHLMMETDQILEHCFLKKLKMMDDDQNITRSYCTPLSARYLSVLA